MKKILIASLLGSAVLGASAAQAAPVTTPAAPAAMPASMTPASAPAATIYGNDGLVKPSAYPFFIKNTLYATSDVMKQLGIDGLKITWDAKTKSYTYMLGDKMVKVTADSNMAWVNGKQMKLEGSPTFKRGVMRVPVTVILKGLGETVKWDNMTKTLWVGDSIK